MQLPRQVTLYNAVTPVAIASSTDATPIVITANAHGRSTGDRVLIFGHTTNVAANGIYVITVLTANTFSLQDEFTRLNVVGSGAGAGAGGLVLLAPPVLYVQDFRNVILQVGTTGTATVTLRIAGSLGRPEPTVPTRTSPRFDFMNMAATVSPANPYSFIQAINLDTAGAVNGATGIVVAGTDINSTFEVNINALKYLTVFPVSWTQGAITIKALLNSTV